MASSSDLATNSNGLDLLIGASILEESSCTSLRLFFYRDRPKSPPRTDGINLSIHTTWFRYSRHRFCHYKVYPCRLQETGRMEFLLFAIRILPVLYSSRHLGPPLWLSRPSLVRCWESWDHDANSLLSEELPGRGVSRWIFSKCGFQTITSHSYWVDTSWGPLVSSIPWQCWGLRCCPRKNRCTLRYTSNQPFLKQESHS